MSDYKSDWNEETPSEDELGRAKPNFPLDREGVVDEGETDGVAGYSQDPKD